MRGSRRLSVIQHCGAEFLGLIEDHFEGRGLGFDYYRPFSAGGRVPTVDEVPSGLVLLGGGPWGSAGPRNVPSLVAEVKLVHACLAHGRPVLGFGLGAQILALAAGGRSHPAPLDFRVAEVRAVVPNGLAGYLPATFPLVIYARDRCEPPPTATVLARDEHDEVALFQLGARSFGFSGHPGFKLAMAEDAIMEFDEHPLEPAPTLSQASAIQPAIEDSLKYLMTGLVLATGWMDD